ncbi:MRN complex-interacting protein-like [Uranotaenia lowii]|uniref:MRN complex-interacting protein-like n=1 Tax=Uranotaenia lowii TaxID=190385 RepID=UPI00247AF543|nr:MRN complex-interacting protein-like [Uranotaenia lowii]
MPQELRVVRCFECKQFQTDIVKKANKWVCKLCGTKQSLLKEYGRGSGRDCRLLAQELSSRSMDEERLEQAIAQQVISGGLQLPQSASGALRDESQRLVDAQQNREARSSGSKWERFRDGEDDDDEGDIWNSIEKSTAPSQNSRNHSTCSTPNGSFSQMPLQAIRDSNCSTSQGSFHKKPFQSVSTSHLRTFDQSNGPKLVPLADFHQMDKKEKKQFKWQSYNNSKNVSNNQNSNHKAKEPEISVTLTNSQVNLTLPTENYNNLKRKSTAEISKTATPIMSFGKRSKAEVLNSNSETRSQISPVKKHVQHTESGAIASSSKWSKFVVPEEDDYE